MKGSEFNQDEGLEGWEVMNMKIVDVYCRGCERKVSMNSEYAKYLNGNIGSCSKCRGLVLAD